MKLEANGYIGGVEITLSHDDDFTIKLTENALLADYHTVNNKTKLVIVAPETDELFTSSDSYVIDEVMVANSTGEVSVSIPSSIEIAEVYPNPFNPSTNLNINIDKATNATIMAYDITGRSVDIVFEGLLDAGMTSVAWEASKLSTGL